MELFPIFITSAITLLVFAAALVGLNYIWLNQHPPEIPFNRTADFSLGREEIPKKISKFSELLKVYIPVLWEFDPSYWIKNIGLDGYSYLYFQREIIKMFLLFGTSFCLLVIPFKIWGKIKISHAANGKDELDEQGMKSYLNEMSSIIDCILVYFFSIYSIFTMFKIKRHIKSQMVLIQNSKGSADDYQRLNSQGLHIRGIFPEDRRGELMIAEIEAFLEYNGGGSVLSTKLIPDFVEIVDLENESKRLDDARKLFAANEPAVRRICFPKQFTDDEYYEKKLKDLDDEIEKVTMKPILSSGHAFICFDSIDTRNKCLNAFSVDTRNSWEACWSIFKDRVATFSPNTEFLRRKRMTSTFQKFNDEEILSKLREKEMKLVMTPLPHPIDIFWSNMGGTRGFFFFRRLIINTAAILILIFLTTPTVIKRKLFLIFQSILRSLQELQFLNFLNLEEHLPKNSAISYLLRELAPPLLILSINQLFLLLIDYSAFMEKHYSFSHCQISIFQRAVLYLCLNMLVIPAITLATADPLFEIIFKKTATIAQALKEFYFSTAGNFFIIVLIQNGAFSGSYHILRLGEIMNSYGSSWLAYYKRQYLNDSERWRRKESDMFQYGYFFAQMVTAFAITISSWQAKLIFFYQLAQVHPQ